MHNHTIKRKISSVEDYSIVRNTEDFNLTYMHLVEISLSCFKWNNLPSSIPENYIERILLTNAQGVFFFEDVIQKYLVLKVNGMGHPNVYGEFTSYIANGENGYTCKLNSDNAVLIYDNPLKCTKIPIIMNYAKKIYDIDSTIRVNLAQMKTPMIIVCDESQRLTMRNFFAKYDGNEPVIYVKNSFDTESIKSFDLKAPYHIDDLEKQRLTVLSEFYEKMGIKVGSTFEKTERLTSAEAERNTQITEINRNARLQSRLQACEKINKKFGLDISVEFNTMVVDGIKNHESTLTMSNDDIEGENFVE